MAVFLLNHCKFNSCGLAFPNLLELIQHIEDTHIESLTDPAKEAVQETQQPPCLPLSSVLRFFSPVAPRAPLRKHLNSRGHGGPQAKMAKLSHSKSFSGSNGKGVSRSPPTPTPSPPTASPLTTPVKTGGGGVGGGSSIGTPSSTRESTPVSAVSNSPPVSDGEDALQSDNENSNDSWTTQDEIPAEVIIKMASKGHSSGNSEDRPYVCPVLGCRKRYKNVNGIKYHAKNAHKKDSSLSPNMISNNESDCYASRVRKPYRCYCGKSYCTSHGLKNHSSHSHKNETLSNVTTNTGEVLQVPSNHIANNNNNITKSKVVSKSESDGKLDSTAVTNPITVTGQIIKGGSPVISKGSTTISSINLTGLVAAGGGKISLKALPNGQLLLSQPLEGKLAALVKSESSKDFSLDDRKSNLLQLKGDGLQQLELGKLLQTNPKSSQHQLAVTTSTISVAIPASTFNSLKTPQRTGLTSTAMLARTLKNHLSSTATVPSMLNLENQGEGGGVVGGQGVILGVTMEEGTLVDNGDGTLSELSVID